MTERKIILHEHTLEKIQREGDFAREELEKLHSWLRAQLDCEKISQKDFGRQLSCVQGVQTSLDALLVLLLADESVLEGNAYDPDYPYRVILNGEEKDEYRDLEDENILSFGSGVRRMNTIEVYHKGELILDVDTEYGKIVEIRCNKGEFADL